MYVFFSILKKKCIIYTRSYKKSTNLFKKCNLVNFLNFISNMKKLRYFHKNTESLQKVFNTRNFNTARIYINFVSFYLDYQVRKKSCAPKISKTVKFIQNFASKSP